MSVYFVTGATGSIGSAVVARLLASDNARVVALVRGRDQNAAEVRVEQALTIVKTDGHAARCNSRLRVLLGDAELQHFGLSSDQHRELSQTCAHIVHCAGAVRMNLTLEDARRASVGSARNVIELAAAGQRAGTLAKVEFLSTVGVAGRSHRVLHEQWVGASHDFHNTYEQAKAEAEWLVQNAIDDGIPITVHRPSMVVGDSQTGAALQFQVFYFLVEFLTGRRTFGLFPGFDGASLDIIPVDFVADVIVRSSKAPAAAGRIMHWCSGRDGALALKRLQQLVKQRLEARGQRLPVARSIPIPVFRTLARTLALVVDAKTRKALATLPVFLDYLDSKQLFDNSRSSAWLAERGVSIPGPEAYIQRVLDYYFDRSSGHSEGGARAPSAHAR